MGRIWICLLGVLVIIQVLLMALTRGSTSAAGVFNQHGGGLASQTTGQAFLLFGLLGRLAIGVMFCCMVLLAKLLRRVRGPQRHGPRGC